MTDHRQTGFIDLHSHLLPGLDDGPDEFGQTLAAAERYRAIGVEIVIATPHWIQGTRWAPSPDQVRVRTAETEKKIRDAGIPLRILPGLEIALTDFLCGHFSVADFVSLAGTGVFLVEFPMNSSISAPTTAGMRTFLAQARGNRFILAHPERCALFQDNPARVRELVDAGMFVQLNIDSVLGLNGKTTQHSARLLLNSGLVHFLGTDSHARANRMPPRPEEMEQLADLIGGEAVSAGFRDNPRRLLAGKDVLPLRCNEPAVGNRTCRHEPKTLFQSLRHLFREQ